MHMNTFSYDVCTVYSRFRIYI
uniref:Uncharacterized protein n=1 Tax=Arundo donax TaxID=35708 RepID=A0A0A9B9A0_ARUDO